MIFVGYDPGLTSGHAVAVDELGRVVKHQRIAGKTLPKVSTPISSAIRVKMITDALFEFLLITRPTRWCLEGYSFGARQQAHQLGELGGVIRYRGLHYSRKGRLPYPIIAPPSSLKKFATGRGNADKVAVAVAASQLWGVTMPSEHAYDALVLAQIARALEGSYDGLLKYQQTAIKPMKELQ